MTATDTFESDPRLSDQIGADKPAWLWSADGTRLLWTNAVGAQIFAPGTQLRETDSAARQIARVFTALPDNDAPRLERLRGFGAPIGGALLCQCSRFKTPDGDAILVVSLDKIRARANEPREAPAAAPAQPATPQPVMPEQRADIPANKPLRFVWLIDAEQNFGIESDDFIRLIGPQTTATLAKPWPHIAQTLGLDPEGRVAAALATNQTFSGVTTQWPVDGIDKRLAVELSGLPVFDAERNVQGFRGFGICRDTALMRELAELRARPPQAAPSAEPAVETPKEPEPAKPEEATAPAPTATVVPFPVLEKTPGLTNKESQAFSEIARELNDRLKSAKTVLEDDFGDERSDPIGNERGEPAAHLFEPEPPAQPAPPKRDAVHRAIESEWPVLDKLPIGILIYRLNELIYANRAFLEWTGYGSLQALQAAGGLDSLFIEPSKEPNGNGKNGKSLTISTPSGKQLPVQGRLFSTQWDGDNALVLMLNTQAPLPGSKDAELAARRLQAENNELKGVLDTAADGIVMFDRAGRILTTNRSAEALFGYDRTEFGALMFGDLFAPESKRAVLDQFDKTVKGGAAALMNQGLEVVGRVRKGGVIPLHISIGRAGDSAEKFCAVIRDITAWKRTEEDLISARHNAEKIAAEKTEFLAKVSREIRTPLNSIIGFSEVMVEEGFGPVENERYRQYVRDIHTAGEQVVALLNELLDLSKIESGKLELTFTGINLNDITQQCVAILQPQANRERVIIRSSLSPTLPQIVADARSVRQIVMNLLSNSIKLTGTGGQVIVSTTQTEGQEVVLRVRDTGAGMSDQEIKAALQPFRQMATASRWGTSGTGLGLPITKALAEANHASFRITSAAQDGTLVEIAFPATRVLA
jgi:PAS domain S-box-containing protein